MAVLKAQHRFLLALSLPGLESLLSGQVRWGWDEADASCLAVGSRTEAFLLTSDGTRVPSWVPVGLFPPDTTHVVPDTGS